MLYNPDHDLYALLALSPEASEDAIREQIAGLRAVRADLDLDHAAAVLLNLHARTRYDAQRATHRMRVIMHESLSVLSGRTPAEGVPRHWPPAASPLER